MAASAKELHDIGAALAAAAQGEGAALATVVATEGSTYRKAGARMLLLAGGGSAGGIGGGCLETDLLERARRVMQTGTAAMLAYDTTDEDPLWGLQLGCGGKLRVWIEPIDPAAPPAYLQYMLDHQRLRKPCAVAAVTEGSACPPGTRLLYDAAGRLLSPPGDAALANRIAADVPDSIAAARIAQRHYYLPDGRWAQVLLEPLMPPPALWILGAGHDAIPLSRYAHELGWNITVADPRAAYASRLRFPEADAVVVAHPDSLAAQLSPDATTAAVVMTHRYEHDRELLHWLAQTPVAYIGLLGPRQRRDALLTELAARGTALADDPRLHAPVGLDLGAETREQVALAIAAEILAVLADRGGGFLRTRRQPIHDRDRD